jgi:diacylglycerol kinase family enzyme
MSERRALLILHGKQALNEAVRAAVEAKRKQGWELAVRLTWEAGDAQRLVEEAWRVATQIIAGGGDGTLRDIAEALAAHPHEASLVLLPLGTANDFPARRGSAGAGRGAGAWMYRRATLTWAQSASRFS